jgi:methionine-rich copper-binding protein CopC
MRRLLPLLEVILAAGPAMTGAFAHAFLDQAAPPVGGTVPASPTEIRLTFSEGVEPHFSGIELAADDGRTITTGPAAIDPGDDKQLVLAVPPLPAGHYRVSWHVVSVDTHRTEGAYSFAVGP